MSITHNLIILAAGRGSRTGRIGDALHKCLLPLDGAAIISQQIRLAPNDCKIIVVVGYRAEQVIEYVNMAHPNEDIEFVYIPNWENGGPAYSLHAGLKVINPLLPTIFVTCDTLWAWDPNLFTGEESMIALAQPPFGTTPDRWMLVRPTVEGTSIHWIKDKEQASTFAMALAWTGLAMVQPKDMVAFREGLPRAHGREYSIGSAFSTAKSRMVPKKIEWLDVGDEAAYREAVVAHSGYDWAKPGQATYFAEGTVIKFFGDPMTVLERVERHQQLGTATPQLITHGESMLQQPFAAGMNVYDFLRKDHSYLVNSRVLDQLVNEPHDGLWSSVMVDPVIKQIHARKFYHDKTMQRISKLPKELRARLNGLETRVPWAEIEAAVQPVVFHGDYTFANIIVSEEGELVTLIDFREKFITTGWGDLNYDLAKLLSSTLVDWDAAARGDFGHSPAEELYPVLVKMLGEQSRLIEIMAGLCLINSAPLHAAPFDEILVSRGVQQLERVL